MFNLKEIQDFAPFCLSCLGRTVGKIGFGLDNREDMSTDVLLNRNIMKVMNVMVNPHRKYIINTKMINIRYFYVRYIFC